MLAKRLPTILPPLSFEEALEATKLYSIAGFLPAGQALLSRRPFRGPNHSISDAGLIGCRSVPRPGEVSLAHQVAADRSASSPTDRIASSPTSAPYWISKMP
jgi:magnesium chelatase family protein